MNRQTLFELTLPYPPSSNRYWRNVQGRMVKSSEARDYETLVMASVIEQLGYMPEATSLPISFTYKLYRPQKSGDLSNRIKILEDNLQGLLYLNDKQIIELHGFRYDDKHNPRVEVLIESLSDGLQSV